MDSDLMRWIKAQADDPNANPRFRELLSALEAAREDACVLRRNNERLAEALRWALPLASQGLEMYRLERLRCGHGDITGTYKNGETWAGIHQEEVDGLERARAALEQEDGRG